LSAPEKTVPTLARDARKSGAPQIDRLLTELVSLLYNLRVPAGLERFYGSNDLHFITCSCYRRQQMLGSPEARNVFLEMLEAVRQKYRFTVVGYVVMPEHFHLLVSEPDQKDLSVVMQVLKQRVSRRLRKDESFWQKRFYDFNVWTAKKETEKLKYMHRNPVVRGLVTSPELWAWSSFRFYLYGERGIVNVNAKMK
jgi:putative transposase